MKTRFMALLAVVSVAILGVSSVLPVMGQEWTVTGDDEWCDHDSNERYCEVREITLAADRAVIAVDGEPNGGIKVRGWDKDEILLRARVRVWRGSREAAREVAGEIEIVTRKRIFAKGPKQHRRRGWSVSYELMVPKKSNLSLETLNGGISIDDVQGEIDFDATNGGVRLTGLSGDVRGRTTNGGLHIELGGSHWEGEGLDVSTTNGGVNLYLPKGYSAELVAGTTNGGIHVDFPITVQGRIGKKLRANLGKGGATVRAMTTNGGVRIRQG
ncbi:MAG: DUF4097 domain-containing protein [Candidatus Krumholzibacteriia bacterium]